MKVKVRVLSNSDYGWFDFWAAIDRWINRGGIEIAREPELAEFESDAEREQGLRIVRGIWNLFAEKPSTEYAMNRDKLDALEEDTLKEIVEMDEPRLEKQHLLNLLQVKHPSHEKDTIRRRVDSIVEKGRLDRIKVGVTTYYSLKVRDRLKREAITIP